MTTVNLQDDAVAFVGENLVFYLGDDFVEMTPVPMADLAACADGRFVSPGGQWGDAVGKLGTFGALIVMGERGTGRRTAALRLLAGATTSGPLHELTPTWKRPRLQLLQPLAAPRARYLLDMSEPTTEPAPADFGGKLVNWAKENSVCLVVTTTDDAGVRRWAESAERAKIRLLSPDAYTLAKREIRAAGAGELRTGLLDDPAFTDIWKSAPKAEDACRLAQLIIEGADRTPEAIADEYQGWRKWIDETLPNKDLGSRTLMWSAAFCDGGQRKSVLRMSEDLRRRLREDRGPAAILRDTPSSQRLLDAEIKPNGDTVRLSPAQHGLAGALRACLWDEFEDPKVREILTGWLVTHLSDLPFDDAERVAYSVLDIVVRFRDDTLLRSLRDKLSGDKHSIAVQMLSEAALDPRFGAHVRASLYDWATSKSHADLVAEICGGAFGLQRPGMALVRLGRAAQNSLPGSAKLASAFSSLAARHPEAVIASITKWLTDYDSPIAGINAFLALASTKQGAVFLCGRADRPGFRYDLISYFQRSLAEPASYDAAISVLKTWENLAAEGSLDPRSTINILGKAIEPEFGNKTIARLHPGAWDTESFWGQAFKVALSGKEIPPVAAPDGEADVSPVPSPRVDEEVDSGAPVYVPAMPAGEETDAGVQAD